MKGSVAAVAEPSPHPFPGPIVPSSAALAQWTAIWKDSSHPSLPAAQGKSHSSILFERSNYNITIFKKKNKFRACEQLFAIATTALSVIAAE